MARNWLKESNIVKMREADKAWLAAAIDGEGSIIKYKSTRGYYAWRIVVYNTSRPFVANCINITGIGKVYNKSEQRLNSKVGKPCFYWMIASQRDVAGLLKQISKFLIIKKSKAQQFLDDWQDL